MNYKQIEFNEIDSTNSYAKRNWNSLDDMTFVFANFQTHGYGRFNRKWESNPKDNLLFSLLIKNSILLSKAEFLPTLFPYIIFKALTHINVNNVSVKWPNDIYVNDKKICGMIFESQLPNYLVVGVGLNVNQTTQLIDTGTSISKELGYQIKIDDLKQLIIGYTLSSIDRLDDTLNDVHQFYLKHNYLQNKQIEFEYNQKKLTGIVQSVDLKNRLVVNINGDVLTLNSGEVKLIKK